jgi:hypothetical protein
MYSIIIIIIYDYDDDDAQVAMRDVRLRPLSLIVTQYKESLREAIVSASSDAERVASTKELQTLKQLLRNAEMPCQRNDARLERMSAVYDSDCDVVESTLSGGRATGAATTTAPAAAAAADDDDTTTTTNSSTESASSSQPAATTTATTNKRRRVAAAAAAAATTAAE